MALNGKSAISLTLALAAATALGYTVARAQDRPAYPSVKRILTQPLDDDGKREVKLEVVTFTPGAAAPEHRHPEHVFVYVLEGEIVSKLEDGPADTFRVGDSFYEPPKGLHAVAKNASDSETAKILVIKIGEDHEH